MQSVYRDERRAANTGSTRDRAKHNPTPAEIAEATATIREGWTETERRIRSRGRWGLGPIGDLPSVDGISNAARERAYRRTLASCYGKPITRHDAPATRRARRIERDIRPTRRRRLWLAAGGCCSYCGLYCSFKRSSLDHVQPKSRGGTRDEENILIACRRCNGTKAAMGLAEWAEFLTGWARRVAVLAGADDTHQKTGSDWTRFLPADAHEVRLRIPKPIYARLVALHGPAPVAGVLSDLLHAHLAGTDRREVA